MASKIDFKIIKSQLVQYIEKIKTNDPFPYPLQAGSLGSMYGSCFAVLTAELLNYKLPDSEKIKAMLLENMDSDTGMVTNSEFENEVFPKERSHDQVYLDLQTSYFARSALYALGEVKLPPVYFALELAKKNEVYYWLDNLDWGEPWLVSNLDMFLGIFLLEHQEQAPNDPVIEKGLAEYFRWHEEKQYPKDGFWGSNKDPLERMAGGYHIFVIYDAIKRKIPYLDEAVVATRKLAWADALYVYGGGGGSCEDMDAIDILVRGYISAPEKYQDMKSELIFVAERLAYSQNNDGGFSWRLPTKLSWIIELLKRKQLSPLIGSLKTVAFKLKNRSHYNSTHLYSSCKVYPFKIGDSDTWSCWFRASALAMIAQAIPEEFENECDWFLHERPGLGLTPLNKK